MTTAIFHGIFYGWAGWPQGKAAVDQQIHRPSGYVKIAIEHGDL